MIVMIVTQHNYCTLAFITHEVGRHCWIEEMGYRMQNWKCRIEDSRWRIHYSGFLMQDEEWIEWMMQNSGCRMVVLDWEYKTKLAGCIIKDLGRCETQNTWWRIKNSGWNMLDGECFMRNWKCRIQGTRLKMQEEGLRINDKESRVQDVGCRMQY